MDYVARHLATGGRRGLFIMADAFTLAKRMQGLTAAAWNEMLGPDRVQAVESSPKNGASFSSLRGKLQREHASRMVGLVLLGDARGAATQPSRHSHRDTAIANRPSRPGRRDPAVEEPRRIDAGFPHVQAQLDALDEAHPTDLRARIGKALEAPFVRKGPATLRNGSPPPALKGVASSACAVHPRPGRRPAHPSSVVILDPVRGLDGP